MIKSFNALFVLIILTLTVRAQKPVIASDSVDHHIFNHDEIHLLEDPEGKLTFAEIRGIKAEDFEINELSTPQTRNLASTYWVRIKVKFDSPLQKKFLLEFFDQTIDHITAYIPDATNKYRERISGDKLPFDKRTFQHKNFEFEIEPVPGEAVYYFKVKSHQRADIIIDLRSMDWFVRYTLEEYFFFGIFYGMIVVFSFYNLLMFFAVKQRQYLAYVLYVLSVGLYQMSIDGIGFQFLWPKTPILNDYAFGIGLYFVSVFSLLFTIDLLHLKVKAPVLYRIMTWVIIIRTGFFILCIVYNHLFAYRLIELIPLSISFIAGIYTYKKGYHFARFFILGYSALFLGFLIKLLIEITDGAINIGILSYYSLSICFILEMIFLSFAVGDRVRVLKLKKDKAKQRAFQEMKQNAELKDNLNRELERQVELRTGEVMEKNKEIVQKSEIIEQQNAELLKINSLLKVQAEEIAKMNEFLTQDNNELQNKIQTVTRARIMSADVDFGEFSNIYPDEESCYKFLAELKWNDGYSCKKCGSENYFSGHLPLSRRCSKCSYEESVTAYTFFQNSRIPINKAFYMMFLIYSTKGKISSHKLSEILAIRQSTCWSYSSKIKKLMEERKKTLRNAGEHGWSKLVLETL